MPVVRTQFQTGESLPALLQQDLGGSLSCPLEILGAGVTPTAGTVILTDGSTTITTGAVTLTNPPTCPVSASALAGKARGMNYEARWSLTITGEPTARTFRQRVGIVRWAPDCPVSNTSLFRSRPVLLRMLQGTNQTVADVWIQDGWADCQRWLQRQGSRANLVCDPSELHDLAEAFIVIRLLEDVSLNADPGGMVAKALSDWREKLKDLMGTTTLTYDTEDTTGVVDTQRAAQSPFYLASWSGNQSALGGGGVL